MLLINSFNLGGAEKLAYDLANKLKEKSDINIVLCSMKSVTTELEYAIKTDMEDKGISCFSIEKAYKGDRLKTITRIRKLLKKEKIDILHTHGQAPDFYGRLAAIGLRTKTIVTIHSTDGYNKLIEYMMSSITDVYTAVSLEASRYGKNILGIKKNIFTIDNGIDIQRYENNNIKIDKNEFNILSVGRVDENKGYLEIIKKVAPFLMKHLDVQWKILGFYDENTEYYKKIDSFIRENKLENQIHFCGTTMNPEAYYIRSDCFILNSKVEGFGIAYIEAMAAGLVVLGNYVGVIQDIYKFGGSIGLIEKIDVELFLEKLYCSRSFFLDEVLKNKQIVEKLYSLENSANKYYAIYKQV